MLSPIEKCKGPKNVSIAIGIRVVFCPGKFCDASRHDKEKNEARNRRDNYVDLLRKEGDI